MAKKLLLALVLASVIAGGAFAKSDPNWAKRMFDIKSGPTVQTGVLFVDLNYTLAYLYLGGFGIGAGWEQLINKNSTWSIIGAVGLYVSDSSYYTYSALDLSAEFNWRYYFFGSALDKLFLNIGVGFGWYSYTYDYDEKYYGDTYKDATYGYGSINVPIYAGWKFIIGPGFVVEPNAGYRIGIGIISPDNTNSLVTKPTYGGFTYGIRLGWAF